MTVLTDSVIYALLAEKGMGPKLYGVFTTGRIEEYVPVRNTLLGLFMSFAIRIKVDIWHTLLWFLVCFCNVGIVFLKKNIFA